MLLNRLEYALMNNALREALQRRFEAPRLRRMGGAVNGGRVLEIGCGRGVGIDTILSVFGARSVDAFDLDPSMVALARHRNRRHGSSVRVWVGSATSISVADASYDAVFDFGIIHHVQQWREAISEVQRVLKPGGTFYAEEVLRSVVCNPLVRRLLAHPQVDRFDREIFVREIAETGLVPISVKELWRCFAWVAARKPRAA